MSLQKFQVMDSCTYLNIKHDKTFSGDIGSGDIFLTFKYNFQCFYVKVIARSQIDLG